MPIIFFSHYDGKRVQSSWQIRHGHSFNTLRYTFLLFSHLKFLIRLRGFKAELLQLIVWKVWEFEAYRILTTHSSWRLLSSNKQCEKRCRKYMVPWGHKVSLSSYSLKTCSFTSHSLFILVVASYYYQTPVKKIKAKYFKFTCSSIYPYYFL